MKTRQKAGPSAWACNSAGQIPCLDAHQGAIPSSGHFSCPAFCCLSGYAPLVLATHSLFMGSSFCHLMDMGPLSPFLLPSSALYHCWCSTQDATTQPSPGPCCPGETNPIIPFRPHQARLITSPYPSPESQHKEGQLPDFPSLEDTRGSVGSQAIPEGTEWCRSL